MSLRICLVLGVVCAASAVALLAQDRIDSPTQRQQGIQYQPRILSAEQCLHGPSETPVQRTRREAALKLAHQINLAEMAATPEFRLPNGPTREYRRLDELRNVPSTPRGFAVNLLTDGQTYSFSIKDMDDPCRYTIFSDHDRWVYEATPSRSAVTLPAVW